MMDKAEIEELLVASKEITGGYKMPQYRFNGRIKATTFKDARVSVLLEDTTFLSNEGDWKQWVDWKLIETGKYKKGEVWVSAFEQSAPEVYQACREIEKGSEVEVEIFKTEKGFLNINNISLKVPDIDVNEELSPPDAPIEEPPEKLTPEQEQQMMTAEARCKEPSTTLDTAASREVLIIRQTCIKAAGMAQVAIKPEEIVEIAKRLEEYVLKGE